MAYDLYPLTPSLKPCKPVDSTDTRYLNQSHTPIANPLKKALHIELYNEKWFDKPLQTTIPPFRYKHRSLKLSTESVSPFPLLSSFITTLTYVLLSLYQKESMILYRHLLLLLPYMHPSTKQIVSFSFIIFLMTLSDPTGYLYK